MNQFLFPTLPGVRIEITDRHHGKIFAHARLQGRFTDSRKTLPPTQMRENALSAACHKLEISKFRTIYEHAQSNDVHN